MEEAAVLNDNRLTEAAAGNIVRVSIPARVAYDLGALQKVTSQVLGQLGCEACHSGFDIRFDAVRDFVVDENLRVRPSHVAGGPAQSV
jgi:hypothetical protein